MMARTFSGKRIVRNTFFLYAKTVVSAVIVLFSTRIVITTLGQQDYGVYGIVGGVIAMLAYLNIAMSQATQRFMNYAEGMQDEKRVLSIFTNTVVLHIVIGIFLVLLMCLLYYPFFHGILNIAPNRVFAAKCIYGFFAISTFATIITVPYEALINAHEDFLYYSVVGVLDSVLKLIAACVLMVYDGDRLILYGALIAVVSIVQMIIMRVYCRKKYKECVFKFKQYSSVQVLKELGSFAIWNFIGVFSSIAGNFGSTILMNHFFGTIVIAAKNIGDQICGQLSILTSNMTKAINPAIVKSEGGGDRSQMLHLSLFACKYGFLLYVLLAVPFIIEMPWVLKKWLGTIPEWAVLFCRLQVIRTLFEQISAPLKMALMAEGSVKQINIIDLCLGLSTFVLLWILYANGFGASAHYYISIIILVIIESVFKVLICKKKCNMDLAFYIKQVLLRPIMACVLSFAFSYVVSVIFDNSSFVNMLVCLLITLVLIILIGLSENDRRIVFFIIIDKYKRCRIR